jgi:hypothetical protein
MTLLEGGVADEHKKGQHLNWHALSKEAWFKGNNATMAYA